MYSGECTSDVRIYQLVVVHCRQCGVVTVFEAHVIRGPSGAAKVVHVHPPIAVDVFYFAPMVWAVASRPGPLL